MRKIPSYFSSSSGDTGEEKKEVDAKPKESRGCETDEIIAVLAHELGHWQHSHALQGFLFGQVESSISLCSPSALFLLLFDKNLIKLLVSLSHSKTIAKFFSA